MGIGNGIVGVIQSDKEITFSVSTLLHNDSIYEVQSGTTFQNGTITVQKVENITASEAGKVTVSGTPKVGTQPVVTDMFGQTIAGTFATGTFTATTSDDIEVGQSYTVRYSKDETGDILSLDSKKFPKNYYVELHTIGYDVNTNEVVCDLYWIFNKALPNGGINVALENAKNAGDDIEFKAQLKTGSDEYGRFVVIPRSLA